MRYSIIFAGSSTSVLEHLARRNDIHVARCFLHEKQVERHCEVVTLCEVYGLLYNVVSSNREMRAILGEIGDIDLGVCCGFEILSEEVFTWPRRGFINIHPSYLPFYKGAHPLYYMLLNNEKEGGVTIHEVTKDVDTGKILAQARYPILFEDDTTTLIPKIDNLAVALLKRYLIKIIRGELKGIDNKGGSYFPPVRGRQYIDLERMLPVQIYNLVRSQAIYGGCYLEIAGRVFCIDKATLKLNRKPANAEAEVSVEEGEICVNFNNSIQMILRIKESSEA